MQFPLTYLFRHRKENLKKCSLRGIENRSDVRFFSFPCQSLPNFENYVLLILDAPPLTREDREHGILLLDGTWRYAAQMYKALALPDSFPKRSLPAGLITAYPRRQTACPSPDQGLASIEALYAALHIMNRNKEGLLDHYFWKKEFLSKNHSFFCQSPGE